LVVIFTYGAKSFFEDYRKKSSLSKENFVLLPDLSLPPTNLQPETTLKVEGYG
jgi:hypothetical protein